MRTEKQEITVYVADDGREFLTEKECEEYETNILERLKNMKYFRVYHNPDLTEGRGYYGIIHVAVETLYGPAEAFLRDWCYVNIGNHVAFVMGASPTENWHIHSITKEQFNTKPITQVGDYEHVGTYMLISDNENFDYDNYRNKVSIIHLYPNR